MSVETFPGVLPSATHPSYPYGNPYTPRNLSSMPSTSSYTPSTSSHTLPASVFYHPAHHSLATTLPSLTLKALHRQTYFGEARDRHWNELGLDRLLSADERAEAEESAAGTAAGDGAGGPGRGAETQPTGQNAGDHPVEHEDESMVGVEDD